MVTSDGVPATTVSGDVLLVPATVNIVPTGLALAAMQSLHHRALGESTGNAGVDALDPQTAFVALSTAVTTALGQLLVLDGSSTQHLLGAISSYAELNGPDGLYALLFAALMSAARYGPGTETDLAVTVCNRYGVPHELSGGALTDPLLHVDGTLLSLVGARDLASAIGSDQQTLSSLITELSQLDGATGSKDAGAKDFSAGLHLISHSIYAGATATGVLPLLNTALAAGAGGTDPIAQVAKALSAALGDALVNRTQLIVQAAQGKALIVDVKLLTSDSAAPAAGAASGTHFALTPQSGTVGQAGAADPIWRGIELPTAVLTGAGIDALMVAMGASVQLQGLPVLGTDGTLVAPGILKSIAPRPPALLAPPSGDLPLILVPAGLLPHIFDLVISLLAPPNPVTGGDPDSQPHPDLVAQFISTEAGRLQLSDTATVADLVAQWVANPTAPTAT